MKYKIEIRSIWEFGQRVDAEGNPHQEDNMFPLHDTHKDTDRLFVLCDGMGGHEAGEVASETVCKAMSQSVLDNFKEDQDDFTDENVRCAVSDAFDALDELVSEDDVSDKRMGTTMTFLKLHHKGCTIAHMGDSRVYHIRPGKEMEDTQILFQTSDHSLVNALIAAGELTPEEAKHSKQKNVITRAMQPRMETRPKADIRHIVDIRKGDYFYLCSDGMLEHMEDDNIRFNFSEETGDIDQKVQMLITATSQNKDNHSAILVHVLEVTDPIPVNRKPQKTEVPVGLVEDGEVAQNRSDVVRQPKKNYGKWIKALVALLFVAAIFLVSYHFFGQETEGAGKADKDSAQTEQAVKPNVKPEATKPQPAAQPAKQTPVAPANPALTPQKPATPQQTLPKPADLQIPSNSKPQESSNNAAVLQAVESAVKEGAEDAEVVSSDKQNIVDVVDGNKK